MEGFGKGYVDASRWWEQLSTKMTGDSVDINNRTLRGTNNKGFSLSISYEKGRERLVIDKPSDLSIECKIKKSRPISKKDFIYVASYYQQWISKEKNIRALVTKGSQNTTYIFSIVDHFFW